MCGEVNESPVGRTSPLTSPLRHLTTGVGLGPEEVSVSSNLIPLTDLLPVFSGEEGDLGRSHERSPVFVFRRRK